MLIVYMNLHVFTVLSQIAIESITNIRTVASLHKEQHFAKMYSDALYGPHKEALKKSHVRGKIHIDIESEHTILIHDYLKILMMQYGLVLYRKMHDLLCFPFHYLLYIDFLISQVVHLDLHSLYLSWPMPPPYSMGAILLM